MAEHLRQVGPYQVDREIGRGGMGVVYLGRDPRLERDVAIKVLPEHLLDDPRRLARFEREARLLASLQNPHIATVYGLEEAGGARYLVLEYVAGETLAERLDRGALPIEEALDVGRQIAVAVEAAHTRGVIHRDLKPANVKVTPAGQVKVLDFGIARSVATGSGGDVSPDSTTQAGDPTARGEVLGTPGYMSPEQTCGEAVDEQADIWAFGCVLFECLAGCRAFPGRTLREAIVEIFTAEPRWERLPPATPQAVRAMLERCLEKDRKHRLGDIKLARAVLEGDPRSLGGTITGVRRGVPNNLPAQVSSFVGRRRELGELESLIAQARLVTLTGSGGCGKTRLALELGSSLCRRGDLTGGVWYVELARVTDPDQVPRAVATGLGLKEQAGQPLTETLRRRLECSGGLVILDNCEHLLSACADLSFQLLSGCPDLRLLVTSREGLGIAGERTYHVPSMSFPSASEQPNGDILRYEAAQLFVERARAANPAFAPSGAEAGAVAEICRRLDGIPLAIELAAARTRALPAAEIARRLDERFRLLTGGSKTALPRHQTLRAAIDWSHSLLAEPERVLLRRLAVFAGGCTLEAVEAICGGGPVAPGPPGGADVLDLLTALVTKSMVVYEEGARRSGRYRLLDTVRQYAGEELGKSGETAAVRDAHVDYFLAFAERADPGLRGPDQASWLERLEADRDNLMAALAWSTVAADPARRGLRLAAALWSFWITRGHVGLGRAALNEALARDAPEAPSPARAQALNAAGILAWEQGDYAAARHLHERSLALRSELGDRRGQASSLNNLALTAQSLGDLPRARDLQQRSLALYRELGDRWGMAAILGNLGDVVRAEGDPAGARCLLEESLGMRRSLGDTRGIVHSLCNLGALSTNLGEQARACEELAEGLDLVRRLGDKKDGVHVLEACGDLAVAMSDAQRAVAVLAAAAALREALGSPLPPGEQRRRDGVIERLQGELGPAAFSAAWRRGRGLSFDGACDAARVQAEKASG